MTVSESSMLLAGLTLNCLPRQKSSPMFIVSVALCSSEFPVKISWCGLLSIIILTYAHPQHYRLCRAW